jgi:hypothetical protein
MADLSERELDTFQDFDYVFDNHTDLPSNNFTKIENKFSGFFELLIDSMDSFGL